ncbi:MAG: PLDc N-terminal domain-containing protein [Bacillota bacterium]
MEISEVVRTLWPLLLLQLVLTVAALIDIARRKRMRYLPKTGWILISLFVATIGPIVYFLADLTR